MALLLSLLAALAAFSCCPGGSLGCNLRPDDFPLSRENFQLLDQMRTSAFFCQEDRKNFRFPGEMLQGSLSQKAQAMSVLKEMLWQTFLLFCTEQSSAAWNQTLLKELQAGLYSQWEELRGCLVEETGEEDSALSVERPTQAVKRYFTGIRLYLKGKKYSDCAWKVVTVEVMRSFSLPIWQEKLSLKDGDLGSA
ncbi:PREDICTED: interferon omega-2-like [Condylura cristata]|uniref:interferon omega-2-like n=1 Tax=Condylura cristata TaxID=143302 RepID=UPI0003346566|nr:PREDICTED: interferon omega-2-like [Condylura cristata]